VSGTGSRSLFDSLEPPSDSDEQMAVDLYHAPLVHREPFDESTEDGQPRPHWARLMRALDEIGTAELARRWARAERRIRENGVTYNVYGDPQGTDRPWKIDMIPLLIPPDQWAEIEAGLIQRAALLSEILKDIYSEQRLVKSGLLPPELLLANPAFLRPMVGAPTPAASYLHMLAVDLARSPDGTWWVLADRTQAPSGAGYALENRTIISDVLPDLFNSSQVRLLAQFFRAQREALQALSPASDPRIVLLTPGPLNETYFEHSYIARYLGFTLVEGMDLTVRDRTVFLKTFTGLQKVDVILRRVDDSFCDPLELRGDSLLGVPGLVDAVLAGNVCLANALGSGVIESASIMPFLPGLCQALRGEKLKLPSVATWWCGQRSARNWVLNNLDSVVVKPAFPARRMEPVFAANLDDYARAALTARIEAEPHAFVAQEQVALSRLPVWEARPLESSSHESRRLESRPLVLRTYVLNTGDGFAVMPGGLVRVAGEDGQVVSMQRGGHSKDAWVLSDEPVDRFSLLHPRNVPVELRHNVPPLPSSTALSFFWLGRYIERSEVANRVLRTVVTRFPHAGWNELQCLVRLYGSLDLRDSKLPRNKNTQTLPSRFQRELLSVLSDHARVDGLAWSIERAYQSGNRVRERLSLDMVHLLNKLRSCLPREPQPLLDYPLTLSGCMELLASFAGLERENIHRGPGWHFLSIGRRLERGLSLCRQLRMMAQPFSEADWPLLEEMLEAADCSMTYRARYYTTLQPLPVLDLLLKARANPRSVDFQLAQLIELYQKLPRHVPADLETMREALIRLRSFDLGKLHYPLPNAERRAHGSGFKRLRGFLDDLEEVLNSWSRNLTARYFSHVSVLPIKIGE
jgi:uncharacterized circularly permuted ATP-grasp superfamily protein/uncharacterized alpha-E superfamily protein